MKYQDELEAGKRSRKEGMTLAQQLEHYRKKLLAKVRVLFKKYSGGVISGLLAPAPWFVLW